MPSSESAEPTPSSTAPASTREPYPMAGHVMERGQTDYSYCAREYRCWVNAYWRRHGHLPVPHHDTRTPDAKRPLR